MDEKELRDEIHKVIKRLEELYEVAENNPEISKELDMNYLADGIFHLRRTNIDF